MNDVNKLAYYFKNYSDSLQVVVFTKTGNFFHDNQNNPVRLIYLCPLCLTNKIGVLGEYQHLDCEFTLDHFPPASVGGIDTTLVCEICNSISGSKFEHELKNFVQEVSVTSWTPGAKIPVVVNVDDVQGNYKGNFVVKGPYKLEWDFPNYPLLTESFKQLEQGKAMIQTVTLKERQLDLIYKSLLKAAYLYCFSRWKYDFAYSNTGAKIRDVLSNKETHPLTNLGVFFHPADLVLPEGLCYIFRPDNLQSFIVTFSLKDKQTGYQFMTSILIPGADDICWQNLKNYQPIIDTQKSFRNEFILLPSDLLSNTNYFPYTDTWKSRKSFKIAGINDI